MLAVPIEPMHKSERGIRSNNGSIGIERKKKRKKKRKSKKRRKRKKKRGEGGIEGRGRRDKGRGEVLFLRPFFNL